MSIELIRGELERLYSLEEMLTLTRGLLGFDPERVGGLAAPASYARALTDYCNEQDAIAALVDAVTHTRPDASPKLRQFVQAVLRAPVELEPGTKVGPFTIARRIGAGPNGTVYAARRRLGEPGVESAATPEQTQDVVVKFLHASAIHDHSALYRFLTRARMVARVEHKNLARIVDVGRADGRYYVATEAVDGKPLAPRVARAGALHINEARALLHGILHGLDALHRGGLVHGAVKLENVLVTKAADGAPCPVLVDVGGDLLHSSWVHSDVATGGGNRIKGMAPEQLRGLGTTARSDFYAFGALLFEVLTGRAPLEARTATELAVAHLSKQPPTAQELAPRGWVSKELSDLCARLLEKEPSKRPATVDEILDVIGPITTKEAITDEQLNECIDMLVADPTDREAAIALELTLERGAKPLAVAEAFLMAAEEIDVDGAAAAVLAGGETGAVGEAKAEAARDRAREVKQSLLFRSARLFEQRLKNAARAEEIFRWLLELSPENDVAREGYERVLRTQEKYEELVEMLLDRSQNSPSHSERALALNKIGHLYAGPLSDMEQAVFAFSKALAQDVQNQQYADDLEKAAGESLAFWAEAMRSLHEVSDHPHMPQEVRVALYMRLGTWYTQKVSRPDLALPCFERALALDPAHQGALDGMVALYRRAQQWKELVAVVQTCIDRAATPDRVRDYRAEAAEIYETKLNEPTRARELYETTLAEDPSHQRTVDALVRIYQRESDYIGLVRLLERRADAQTGYARAETFCRIGELHEEKLSDISAAQHWYEQALALEPTGLSALRSLDRIFSRTGKYAELLDNLHAQIRVAATPRQRITLYERIAGIQEEEFLDNARAAEALERVLEIDHGHEGAMTRLLRLYRSLERWDDVVALYDKLLGIVEDDSRSVDLLLAQGEVLLDKVGAPDRARHAYEKVLELDPMHAGALQSLAELRAATGDALAALAAVESLAEKAVTPGARAELWIRAGKILEERGDRDGAIERYKTALDANPKDHAAALSLRMAYLARGDASSAAALVEKEIEGTEGDLAKARLYSELAELLRDRLQNPAEAKEAASRAVSLDASNLKARRMLGDLAVEAGSHIEASKHYAELASRLDAIPAEDRKAVLMQYIDSLAKSGSTEQAQDNVQALLDVAPDDPDAISRAARVRLDSGNGAGAAELYQMLRTRFFAAMSHDEQVRVLLNHGRALRLAGDAKAAIAPFNEVAEIENGSTEAYEELVKTYGALGDWEQVVQTKKRLLDLATDEQRSTILLEIGEVLVNQLKDPTRAAKSLVAALEERPEDRRILARLMKLYSEEKDWSKLVEVVLKLAEGVSDAVQKAKYVHTAAVVSAQQLGDVDAALKFLDQVLELDPTNQKAIEESIDLRQQKGDHEAAVVLLRKELEQARAAGERPRVLSALGRLAEAYRDKLGNQAEAIAMLEQAQALEPENADLRRQLYDLYASDVPNYLERAVEIQRQFARENPLSAEPLRNLRKLYTEGRVADAAWCLCQALHCMQLAEADEERFYRRMRSETAAEAKRRLTDDDWNATLLHPDLDPLVTAIFTAVEPAIVRKNAKPLESLGYQPAYAIDLSVHPYPMSQTLFYAAGVLGMTPPMTFMNPNDPGGVSFLHGRPPAIVLGSAALATELPTQAAAFIAARHLTYYRPGLYVRHLVPTGTGLRSWLFAAVRLIHSGFPIAPEMDAMVKENVAALESLIVGPPRDRLASSVSKLLQSGAIDLKRWVAAVDLTADRAGFLVCHDLDVACEMVRAAEEGASAVPARDRIRDLTNFSISVPYFDLRKQLGINIDR